MAVPFLPNNTQITALESYFHHHSNIPVVFQRTGMSRSRQNSLSGTRTRRLCDLDRGQGGMADDAVSATGGSVLVTASPSAKRHRSSHCFRPLSIHPQQTSCGAVARGLLMLHGDRGGEVQCAVGSGKEHTCAHWLRFGCMYSQQLPSKM